MLEKNVFLNDKIIVETIIFDLKMTHANINKKKMLLDPFYIIQLTIGNVYRFFSHI